MPLLILLLFLFLVGIALVPFGIMQRYRRGTARQRARRWVILINVAALSLSVTILLVSAVATSIWVAETLTHTVAGLVAGAVLGALGLRLTRWETGHDALHFTPFRWLVLAITLMVTARLIYGLWRVVQAWQLAVDRGSWLVSAGVPGSMAAGAVVLGYYFVYWLGVHRRFRRHVQQRLQGISKPRR